MIVKVSKRFAKFINDTAKKFRKEFHADVVEVRELWGDDADYNWETGMYKKIRLTYPSDYYACPQYLSTKYLNEEFRRRGVRTCEELEEMIVDLCEI